MSRHWAQKYTLVHVCEAVSQTLILAWTAVAIVTVPVRTAAPGRCRCKLSACIDTQQIILCQRHSCMLC